MKFLFTYLFICFAFFVNAQSNANFQLGRMICDADYNDNISCKDISTLKGFFAQNTISNSKGNLLFYTKEDSIFYNDGKVLNNGTEIFLNPWFTVADYTWQETAISNFLKINNDLYYLIASSKNNDIDTGALMYTIIKKDINGNWNVISKNNVIRIGNAGFININRNPDESFGMITRFDNTIFYYKIENGIFILKDSLYQQTDNYPKNDFNTLISRNNNPYHSEKMILNSFGNEGYFFKNMCLVSKKNTLYSYNYFKLYHFSIDKKTDKILSLELMDSKLDSNDIFNSSQRENTIPLIMPNDSLLIFVKVISDELNHNSRNFLIIYDLFGSKDTIDLELIGYQSFTRTHILPSGNLMIYKTSENKNISSVNCYYSTYNNEELKYKIINKNIDTFLFNYKNRKEPNDDYRNYYSSYQLFDYLRIEPEINYSCDTVSVKLKNLSNKSNGINDFRFYVCKDSACNQIDSFKTFEPIISFTKNGKYPYKVYGYSPSQSGYGEWYYDTIVVNNKMKVKAEFSVSDSVICRYKDVSFTNKSSVNDSSIFENISSHWFFANEKDTLLFGDNQNIKYAFTQTGIRNVKLIYGSGFCADTFSQNIEVIDAPTPGFSLNNLIGCTPFELIVNDTHTRFVKQKEYYNSFKNVWDTIPLNQTTFSYQFSTVGNYYLIQKLVGANGCVIVRDTARIIVRPGITNLDSTQIYYASYLDNQNIELVWNKTEAAKNYHLFSSKNGISFQNLAEITDTFYTHNIKTPQVIYYQVSAIDSCGTASKISNFSKPVYLQTSLFGQNEKAIITYTPYEKLPQNISSYNIYVLDTLGNTQQVYLSNSSTYNDENITDYDLSKICYQITFPHPTILKEIKSNISCVNVLPTLFIPNSFTPNNDGKNDEFYPSILGIEYYNLYIYDRWGQFVGEFNKDKNWNGKDAPEGVYIYYIRAKNSNGKIINGKGNITLLR